MPYIKDARKYRLCMVPLILAGTECKSPGELNWALTTIALGYLYKEGTDPRYAGMAEVMGAFTCAAQEFYRRVMVPYEQEKREENGDVY